MNVLAANLNRLIGAGKKFTSNEAASAASGVGRSTIDRARKSEVSLRLDNLDALAKAVNVEPWELLYPGLDTNNRPKVASPTEPPNWPLPGVSVKQVAELPADEIEELILLIKNKVARQSLGKSKSTGEGKAA